jgi:hypothetical protein
MDDSATILFGLPGVAVTCVERAADAVRVVHVRTADEAAAASADIVLHPPVLERLHAQRVRQVHLRAGLGQHVRGQYQP